MFDSVNNASGIMLPQTTDNSFGAPTVPPTNTSDHSGQPEGAGKNDRQHWVVAMIIAALVLIAAVVVIFVQNVVDSKVQAALASYDLPTNGVLPATVEIVRDAGVAVECELFAVDDRQVVVGQTTVEVPAGDETHLRVDVEIPLEGDGIVAKLSGCKAV